MILIRFFLKAHEHIQESHIFFYDLMGIRFDQLKILSHIKPDIVKVAKCDIIKWKI